jgi:hypothetical protein
MKFVVSCVVTLAASKLRFYVRRLDMPNDIDHAIRFDSQDEAGRHITSIKDYLNTQGYKYVECEITEVDE